MAKRILIVDDDLYIRELYVEVLTDAGFAVEAAIDGREGLNKLLIGGYDLILLDVMMPQLDGLQVLSTVAESTPQNKNGPIVLLTNLSHDPIIQEGLSKGAASYLIKADITPEELVKKIQTMLEK